MLNELGVLKIDEIFLDVVNHGEQSKLWALLNKVNYIKLKII